MMLTKNFGDKLGSGQRSGGQLADPGMPTPGTFQLRVDGERLKCTQRRVTGSTQLFHEGRTYLADVVRRGSKVRPFRKQEVSKASGLAPHQLPGNLTDNLAMIEN